jgi:hypothetical protein
MLQSGGVPLKFHFPRNYNTPLEECGIRRETVFELSILLAQLKFSVEKGTK